MKTLILTTAVLMNQHALASDHYKTDIVCHEVTQAQSSDSGIVLLIQSNPTAWMKRIAVLENGHLIQREIGSINIPLNQPYVSTPSYFDHTRIATYRVEGLDLSVSVHDVAGKNPAGAGELRHLQLPGHAPLEQLELVCELGDE